MTRGTHFDYPSLELWEVMMRQNGETIALTLHKLALQWIGEDPKNFHLRSLVLVSEQVLTERGIPFTAHNAN